MRHRSIRAKESVGADRPITGARVYYLSVIVRFR